MKKIAVLAGNYKEFRFFTKDNDKYIYIDSPEKTRGREFSKVLTYGTWYKRKNVYDLLILTKSRIREN